MMNKTFVDIIASFFFTVLGLCMLILRKTFAHGASEFYYRLLHIRFNEKGYQIGFFIGGLLFTILGCLSLFGIIKFK